MTPEWLGQVAAQERPTPQPRRVQTIDLDGFLDSEGNRYIVGSEDIQSDFRPIFGLIDVLFD